MNLFRVLVLGLYLAAPSLRAVYAPIPESERGKNFSGTIRSGLSYDSNIFGASGGAIDSAIFTVAPHVAYNASLTDQTFLAATYGLTLDYFLDRPGKKLLDSHDLSLRLAHAFTKTTTLDVIDILTFSRNPESLLAGVPVSIDQSFNRNQLDGRFNTAVNPKALVTVKARSVLYDYRSATLGRSLDRTENIVGFSGDYAVLPEVKAVAEIRHQDVFYRKQGEIKNKRSDFVLGGVDYAVAKKLSVTARAGAEWRHRRAEEDVTAPYAEFSGKYNYAPESFLVGGYAYTLEESSDIVRFTDAKVHRFFASVQHHVTALIVASGSLSYEPSQLQARRGLVSGVRVSDLDETTVRTGAALSYLPTKNWVLSASYDYDRIRSDDRVRTMERHRLGLNATYAF